MPKISKVQNYTPPTPPPHHTHTHTHRKNITDFVQKLFNSLAISNKLTKFQIPSSNSSRAILLSCLNSQIFQRVITPYKINRFHEKVNQFISSAHDLQSANRVSSLQHKNFLRYLAGQTPKKNNGICPKINRYIYLSLLIS